MKLIKYKACIFYNGKLNYKIYTYNTGSDSYFRISKIYYPYLVRILIIKKIGSDIHSDLFGSETRKFRLKNWILDRIFKFLNLFAHPLISFMLFKMLHSFSRKFVQGMVVS